MNPRKRPTLADVAAAAGVSMMTASRVINNKPGVSDEVRQNVQQVAEALGYHPNQIARSLVTNRTATVGLIVPDNTNPFFAQIARGSEDVAYDRQYNVFLLNAVENQAREIAALNSLWQKGVDGIIWCSSRLASSEVEEQINRFPAVVLINRELSRPASNAVAIIINDQRGAQMAVEYLLAQGRRKIAYLNGPLNSLSGQRRMEGYQMALRQAGKSLDETLEACCSPDTEGGFAAATALLARCPEVDAILAYNDLAAAGAMQACIAAGREVPSSVAIVGFDDIPLARILKPQLTTLHVNLAQIGRFAMQSLLEIIENAACPATITIEPELIIRESA